MAFPLNILGMALVAFFLSISFALGFFFALVATDGRVTCHYHSLPTTAPEFIHVAIEGITVKVPVTARQVAELTRERNAYATRAYEAKAARDENQRLIDIQDRAAIIDQQTIADLKKEATAKEKLLAASTTPEQIAESVESINGWCHFAEYEMEDVESYMTSVGLESLWAVIKDFESNTAEHIHIAEEAEEAAAANAQYKEKYESLRAEVGRLEKQLEAAKEKAYEAHREGIQEYRLRLAMEKAIARSMWTGHVLEPDPSIFWH